MKVWGYNLFFIFKKFYQLYIYFGGSQFKEDKTPLQSLILAEEFTNNVKIEALY